MDQNKIDMFITANSDKFEPAQLAIIKQKLSEASDDKFMVLQCVKLQSPTTNLIISLFLGAYGIDRFMVGDTGLGIGKLLTLGGCGFWAIIDWFMISGRTREVNYQKVVTALI